MRLRAIGVAVAVAASLFPSPSQGAGGTCPDEPCGCNGPDPVYLVPYFVPNYSGWQTAKRIWTYSGGGSSAFRIFQYAPNKYEIIKSPDGKQTETFEIGATWIVVTSEMFPAGSNTSREFVGDGLVWMPTIICPNKRYYPVYHDGERLLDANTCGTIGSTNEHHARYSSRIDFAPTWNYGYSVGVVDSIILIDTLDDGKVEKYWYGKNRGLLRWEYWSARERCSTGASKPARSRTPRSLTIPASSPN